MNTSLHPIPGHAVSSTTADDASRAVGSAHGKVILVGEHSVVYGAPAIAVPVFSTQATATLQASKEPAQIRCQVYQGPVMGAPHRLGPTLTAWSAAAERWNVDAATGVMTIDSSIPVGRGLGSSAAVAAAVIRAVAAFADHDLTADELHDLIQLAETVAHGTPSGLDARAVVADEPLRFQRGTASDLAVSGPLRFVVADSGVSGATSTAVTSVRMLRDDHRHDVDRAVSELADLTDGVVDSLHRGDVTTLGQQMNSAHETLVSLGVSGVALDRLVDQARSGGALGAKLTGGGLGGCVLALVAPDDDPRTIERSSALRGGRPSVDDDDRRRFVSRVTARAYPNLALVKYWGKADSAYVLPQTGSLSLTLDHFPTTTTVTVSDDASDRLVFGGRETTGVAAERVYAFLDIVRDLAGSTARAVVDTVNEAPTGAGLASSASGFAALAVAASGAYGLDLDTRDLSRLARRGSGSAARSVISNLAVWHAGDDASSFAESVPGPDLRMVIVTIDASQKAVSSREAMKLTAATSPFHEPWVTATALDLDEMIAACAADDFTRIGELTESNALRMHAVINAARPPIRYLTSASVAVFDAVAGLRRQGIEAYATADAGPNVAVLCRPADVDSVSLSLAPFGAVQAVGPGPGAAVVAEGATA